MIRLVAGGATNREIAERLEVRADAVKTLARLEVRKRAEPLAEASALGILKRAGGIAHLQRSSGWSLRGSSYKLRRSAHHAKSRAAPRPRILALEFPVVLPDVRGFDQMQSSST